MYFTFNFNITPGQLWESGNSQLFEVVEVTVNLVEIKGEWHGELMHVTPEQLCRKFTLIK